ncbi:MAG: helix-turn-helix domain-containing protein [Candidatus Eisenbacteria bacterium]
MPEKIPAVFSPGEHLREELEARGWMQEDLADITGLPLQAVSEIMTAKRSITPEVAHAIGEALGTSAKVWMNLDAAYRLTHLRTRTSLIPQKSKLYQKAPIREMIRRGWMRGSDDFSVLEKKILDFFEIKSLDDEPAPVAHAARTSSATLTAACQAWLYRAKKLAMSAPTTQRFTDSRLSSGLDRLRALLRNPQEVCHVPEVLADAGIRFVILEHLRGTKIDGACFWLNDASPVIVLTLRYDRLDYFWFTLLHEIGHVMKRDSLIDIDLIENRLKPSDDTWDKEVKANEFASDFLIRSSDLDSFVSRVGPLYSKIAIKQFAARLNVHPGIVVGQLQFRDEIGYQHSREMLEKIRKFIVPCTLTDGWGHTVTADI